MNWKCLLISKTFWTGIATIASGIYECTTGNIPNGITQIAVGLSAIFVRDAIAGNQK